MQRRKFLVDSILNIISTTLPLMVLQLVSLPIMAKRLGPDNFGLVITIISIITVISFPLGNVLNNIRLLRNENYVEEKINGDFNYLLIGTSLIGTFLILIVSILFMGILNWFNLLVLILIVVLSIFKEYLIVNYRLTLNFKGVLLNNTLLSIGYIIGTVLFNFTGIWEFIYLIGLTFNIIYIVYSTNLLAEPFIRTRLFKTTLKDFSILYGSSLLNNFLNYADKIILLPLLGAKNVSVYFAASIIGKIISMIFNPINSVILSYIVKLERINHKKFMKIFFVISLLGGIFYFVTVQISSYFLNFFYPFWAEESLDLIYITSAIAIVTVLSSLFQPFNLRYNNLKWQLYMSGSNLIFYLIIAYFLTNWFGLIGFTIAVLCSGIFKFGLQIYTYFSKVEKEK